MVKAAQCYSTVLNCRVALTSIWDQCLSIDTARCPRDAETTSSSPRNVPNTKAKQVAIFGARSYKYATTKGSAILDSHRKAKKVERIDPERRIVNLTCCEDGSRHSPPVSVYPSHAWSALKHRSPLSFFSSRSTLLLWHVKHPVLTLLCARLRHRR